MRYLLKFSKKKMMKYISHLDMMRFFQRALKRAGVRIEYSQGFSPHPKMSIIQPLTLGYESIGEYLEIHAVAEWDCQDLKARLNSFMPEGLKIIDCSKLPKEGKAAGALICCAEYEIFFPLSDEITLEKIQQAVLKFQKTDQVLVQKLQKKSGKQTEINIKDFVRKFQLMDSTEEGRNMAVLSTVIDAGSNSHLNPEHLIAGFQQFLTPEKQENTENQVLSYEKISRIEMYAEGRTNDPIPLFKI